MINESNIQSHAQKPEKQADRQKLNTQLVSRKTPTVTETLTTIMPRSIEQYSTNEQEAQLMLTTGSTRLAVSRGQQTWYHFRSIATFR